MRNDLKFITQKILNTTTKLEELKYGALLDSFLNQKFNLTDKAYDEFSKETIVSGGVALSPKGAVNCTKEYYRTTRFIKGVYNALTALFERFPGEQIHIMYAGCGPYAPLILPILTLLQPGSVKVTLLDISPYSINIVDELVNSLNLGSFIKDYVVTDATTYIKKPDDKIHLIVSETMFRALIREPQVAIIANLAPQLEKDGILVPEEIKVELGYSFFAEEPYYQYDNALNTSAGLTINLPQRIILDTVITIEKNINLSGQTKPTFESKLFRTPYNPLMETPDLCLFTTIKIFGDIELNSTESTITNPHVITSIANRFDNRLFRVRYCFNDIPDWKFELK